MEICFLCLELRNESVPFIKVDTIHLPNESVEEMIEKYLWPMESISSNSWLCKSCWQILYDFHKFYTRIEEAHEDLANMLDVGDDTPFQKAISETNCEMLSVENLNNQSEETANVIIFSGEELAMDNDLLQTVMLENAENFQTNLNGSKATQEEQALGLAMHKDLQMTVMEDNVENFQTSATHEERGLGLAMDNDLQMTVMKENAKNFKTNVNLSNTTQQQGLKENETLQKNVGCHAGTEDPQNSLQQHEENANTDDDLQTEKETDATFKVSQIEAERIIDEDLIIRSEDNTKQKRDPLKRPSSVKVIVFETGEKLEVRNAVYQTLNINADSEMVSDDSNDTESTSDTNSSETTEYDQQRKNYKRDAESYDKLPNNKKDEDNKIIGENIELKCEICQEIVKTFHELRCHYKNQHNKHGHIKCCGKTYKRRNLLADHMRWHLDPEYFKCNMCGKLLAERRCLDIHMLNMHQNMGGKRFVCDICGKSFGDNGILKNHKTSHLSKDEKKFQCAECNKKYGSKYLLNNHISTVHLKKYTKICDICGKHFQVKLKFERHMLEHKGISQPTEDCAICGFRSVSEAGLRRHKETQHPEGGKMEYKCHLCPKVSPSLRAHKVHVQYKHELGLNFKCTVCEKAFKRAQTLKEHMAIHTKTDLYKCPHCPMTFKANANMHKHRKNAHPEEWENARRKKFSGFLPPTQKPATF